MANAVSRGLAGFLRGIDWFIFPDQLAQALARETRGAESVLDLGCGAGGPFLKVPRLRRLVGVDGHKASLEKLGATGVYDQLIEQPINGADFPPGSFDVVTALDVVEHFSEEEALQLMGRMERWASKKIIIHTPNGFLPQPVYDSNPWQEHKCGFTAARLREMGFRVSGTGGPKWLRKEFSEFRYRPAFLWHRISGLLQPVTRAVPGWSFGLFAVKEIR